MTIFNLFFFIGFAIFTSVLRHKKWRKWLLFSGSVVAIYWLQPSTPIRHLDFWLPTATLALIGLVYFATRPSSNTLKFRSDLPAVVILTFIVLGIALLRYLGPLCCITSTSPPQIWIVATGLLLVLLIWIFDASFFPKKTWVMNLLILLLLVFFILQKNESLSIMTSAGLRSLTGQSIELAARLDISWIGFSYIAFRLIHVLRDRITGRLPEINLREMMTYTIFFPTITAGPIDRVQRFIRDLQEGHTLQALQIIQGGRRILIGLFKKFALADSLALVALNAQNASQINSTAWTWVMLYAYSFRIYFDFSGYTDIALGIGQLVGFSLPENFNRSYLQSNLTTFWNNWHMTLTNWFRAYFFNPLTRAIRSSKRKLPMWLIILVGQLSTMVLIGLWHGSTWNFVIWGTWHGIGLFVHNRWAGFARSTIKIEEKSNRFQKLINGFGVVLTFNYVSIGWLWFVLPSPEIAYQVFKNLLGL
jgi:D-alanyl-lipoteichoic acid acyltransferase DltB (MBOAT superfamily)